MSPMVNRTSAPPLSLPHLRPIVVNNLRFGEVVANSGFWGAIPSNANFPPPDFVDSLPV